MWISSKHHVACSRCEMFGSSAAWRYIVYSVFQQETSRQIRSKIRVMIRLERNTNNYKSLSYSLVSYSITVYLTVSSVERPLLSLPMPRLFSGGCFKNRAPFILVPHNAVEEVSKIGRKPIGEFGCCGTWLAEQTVTDGPNERWQRLWVSLSICLCLLLSVSPCLSLSFSLSLARSISLSIDRSIHRSIYLSINLIYSNLILANLS